MCRADSQLIVTKNRETVEKIVLEIIINLTDTYALLSTGNFQQSNKQNTTMRHTEPVYKFVEIFALGKQDSLTVGCDL